MNTSTCRGLMLIFTTAAVISVFCYKLEIKMYSETMHVNICKCGARPVLYVNQTCPYGNSTCPSEHMCIIYACVHDANSNLATRILMINYERDATLVFLVFVMICVAISLIIYCWYNESARLQLAEIRSLYGAV